MKLIATLAVAALAVTLAPTIAHAEPEPTRILIVGDSVTQGHRGDYTWRYFMQKALPEDAAEDFVGRRTGTFQMEAGDRWNWDYDAADAYADPDFDQDHGALWGGRLTAIDNSAWDPIGEQVATHQADVIMSLWGINDLGTSDGPADLIASYRDWVAEARAVNSGVDFVIGELPYTWVFAPEPADFNALLGDLAAELSTDESRIVIARMAQEYTPADTTDGIHPNVAGQQKLGAMMRTALVGVLPELVPVVAPVLVEPVVQAPVTPVPALVPAPMVPVVAPPVVPQEAAPARSQVAAPFAPRKVRAEVKGRRVIVSWRAVRGAESYAVKCGRAAKTVTRTTTALRVKGKRCQVRAVNVAGASPWAKVRIRA